jgi:hypothetical protein
VLYRASARSSSRSTRRTRRRRGASIDGGPGQHHDSHSGLQRRPDRAGSWPPCRPRPVAEILRGRRRSSDDTAARAAPAWRG